mgnify:CR=1 FL=1
MLGFEIVAYAGDARSKLLEALNAAQQGDFNEAEQLIEGANQCIVSASILLLHVKPNTFGT